MEMKTKELLYAIAKGTYTLHEKEVPDGYVCAEDMEIEIKETADTQEFVMEDDPIQAEIEKVDYENGDSLPGATLQLIVLQIYKLLLCHL